MHALSYIQSFVSAPMEANALTSSIRGGVGGDLIIKNLRRTPSGHSDFWTVRLLDILPVATKYNYPKVQPSNSPKKSLPRRETACLLRRKSTCCTPNVFLPCSCGLLGRGILFYIGTRSQDCRIQDGARNQDCRNQDFRTVKMSKSPEV